MRCNQFNQQYEDLIYLLMCEDGTKVYEFLQKKLDKAYNFIQETTHEYLICIPKQQFAMHPIALVAHVDTMREVFAKIPSTQAVRPGFEVKPVELLLREDKNEVFNKNGILGADDRAGVYAILRIVDNLLLQTSPDLPLLIFPNYEESGGKGAAAICKTKILESLQEKIHFMVEIDRRGDKQFVYYTTHLDAAYKELLTSVGFHEEQGTYSDVSTISETYPIFHANVSAGYTNEHSLKEILHIDWLENTIAMMGNLLAVKEIPKIIYEEDVSAYGVWNQKSLFDYDRAAPSRYSKNTRRNVQWDSLEFEAFDDYDTETFNCICCEQEKYATERTEDNILRDVCITCEDYLFGYSSTG